MGYGGRMRKRGWGKKPKPNNPLSLIPYPQVFQQPDLGVKSMLTGEGDVKATDFLTSLAVLAPHLQLMHLGSQGWGKWGRARGDLEEEGALPLSSHKIQVPPATFLAQREAWGF